VAIAAGADRAHGSGIATLINHQQARTVNGGQWAAWFDAPFGVRARIFSRPLSVDPGPGPARCSASAWVKRRSPRLISPAPL
jgi:hypothetical protein